MVNAHGWDVAHAIKFRCLCPGMSRNNFVGTINQDWIDASEFFEACRNLLDLFSRVRARVLAPRF
jgi:hypothetical protein